MEYHHFHQRLPWQTYMYQHQVKLCISSTEDACGAGWNCKASNRHYLPSYDIASLPFPLFSLFLSFFSLSYFSLSSLFLSFFSLLSLFLFLLSFSLSFFFLSFPSLSLPLIQLLILSTFTRRREKGPNACFFQDSNF